MKIKSNLQAKILLLVLTTVILVFLFIGLFVGVRNRNFAVEKAHEYTQLMAEKYAQNVSALLQKHTGFVTAMANGQPLGGIKLTKKADSVSRLILNNQLATNPEYQSVWILWKDDFYPGNSNTTDGFVLVKDTRQGGKPQVKTNISEFESQFGFIMGNRNIVVGEPFLKDNKYYSNIAAPIVQNGMIKGFAGVTLDLSFFTDFINDSYIYEGGFITVLTNEGKFIAHANEGFVGRTFNQNFPEEGKRWSVEQKVKSGERFEISTKFSQKTYYSYFVPVNLGNTLTPWSVEVTVPMHKILESSSETIRNSVYVALFGVILMILVIWRIARRISRPVKKVTRIMELLSTGDIDNISKIKINSGDELEAMGNSVNHLVNGLKKTEVFALEIGKGNLEEQYTLLGDNDQIGKALMDMRDSLKKSRQDEITRKEEEDKRNWSTQGIAKFGDILRQDTGDLKTLGYNIISNLIEYLNVNQGALFVLNEEEEEKQFDLTTAIAYGRDKLLKKSVKTGESLVGRCAYEKKTIYLTDVPDDYVNITSGLGTANPKAVLLVPCVINEEVYSVIELASFSEFQPHEIEFVEKLGESIASTISSVRISEKTNRLLTESQKQGEEMASQEEELRQNLEEMEATQEDLQRQMKTNAEMREKMQKQNALLDSLLRNLPDYIYFKDEESRFLRISDSMLKLFGANSVDEVVGKSDFDFQTKENAEKYFRDEKEIMESRTGFMNKLQKEEMPDGNIIWNSVTKMPLIDENNNVIGTFGISKDVTELKEMEIIAHEQSVEMKKQNALLDALLKYLPDYIYFKDEESRFLSISESMTHLFGAQSVDEVIGKSDFDYHTPENAEQYYQEEKEIMRTRKGFTDRVQKEIMPDGAIIWNSVSKLPLIDENDNVIGTFGISKDITKVKEAELELREKQVELAGVSDALHESTYMVEYNTDGVIIDVNEAMANLFKLDKNKLIGTQHRDGIETSKTDKEYKEFWAKLLNGEPQREHTRLLINKKEVYLSETYTPIKDADGQVYKIMKIAFDVTDFVKSKK